MGIIGNSHAHPWYIGPAYFGVTIIMLLITAALWLVSRRNKILEFRRGFTTWDKERKALSALLKRDVELLRSPELAAFLTTAWLTGIEKPFTTQIRARQKELDDFCVALVGQSNWRCLIEGLAIEEYDRYQMELLNIAWSVNDTTLEWLVKRYNGRLSTVNVKMPFQVLMAWQQFRENYEQRTTETKKDSSRSDNPFWLSTEAEQAIQLCSGVRVYAEGVVKSADYELANLLKWNQLPEPLGEQLRTDLKLLRARFTDLPTIEEGDWNQETYRKDARWQAEQVRKWLEDFVGRIALLCAQWSLAEAAFAINRKWEALEAGKPAFKGNY